MSQSQHASIAVARRYAHAAFALAVEAKKEAALADEISVLARAIEGDAPLRAALSNPLIDRATKEKLLDALIAKADSITRRTVAVVASGGRADLLPAIASALRAMLVAHRGELVADITSARPLSAAMQKQLSESLTRATGKKLQMQLHEDARLIGGVVIQLGSLRLDASLSGALNAMRGQLLGASA
ncbi:MAG: ATP synthase F1 subunit delta [Rickettsiales bacterium]